MKMHPNVQYWSKFPQIFGTKSAISVKNVHYFSCNQYGQLVTTDHHTWRNFIAKFGLCVGLRK